MGEIRVVAQNGGGGGSTSQTSSVQQPASSQIQGGGTSMSDKMFEEFRRLAQQRGIAFTPGSSDVTRLMNQYSDTKKQEAEAEVKAKYSQQRIALDDKYAERENSLYEKYQGEFSKYDKYYKGEEEDIYKKWVKGGRVGKLEDREDWKELEKEKEDDYKRLEKLSNLGFRDLEKDKKAEENELNKSEKDELKQVLKDISASLKETKERAERETEQNGGYLHDLKQERKELIRQREYAPTKEEAMAANKRLSETNKRIQEAEGVSDEETFRRTNTLVHGIQQTIDGLQSGNPGAIVNGIGSSVVGAFGGGVKALGWVGLAAAGVEGIWKAAQGSGERFGAVGQLAAMMNGGGVGATAVRAQMEEDSNMYGAYGISTIDFAHRATQLSRARGGTNNWERETLYQIGLEKTLALDSGRLLQASSFDRYGQPITTSVIKMVDLLSTIENSGVKRNDLTRVQEKLDAQQQIMGSYMSRADKPNYDVANQAVAAFSAVSGITQDSGLGSDYATIQNVIQNPSNPRLQALIYSTVQEMMPQMVKRKYTDENGVERTEYFNETDAGSLAAIDRAIKNPENELRIMQSLFKNLKNVYGDMEQDLGYFSWTDIFERKIAPDRLEKYIEAFTNPESKAAKLLSGERGQRSADEIDQIVQTAAEGGQQYISTVQQAQVTIQNKAGKIIDKISDLIDSGIGIPVNISPSGGSVNNTQPGQ